MMTKNTNILPSNLTKLHNGEEELRQKALGIITADKRLQLHLTAIESVMDLADIFRQLDTNDENLKVTQILAMRTFNAFAASLKLALSGYNQNSAMILRDVLETVFLLSLFAGDRTQIERWRLADKKTRMKEFSPVKVREKLDLRDGLTSKRRAEIYELFSELASHPTMKSDYMMRPQKDGDAVIGPFMEATALEAVISEMGRLAVQVGELINAIIPATWALAIPTRLAFSLQKRDWLATFYPDAIFKSS
ncbi:hypothetical protein [Agrobacterium sp. fls2-241-TYG-188a]|uniref:hypothetical protein n=1 Tax=Agrobacterium sp. fls2-241-TYG-188a TaxID=3040275 RepID=UPI00254B7986|nr:hypothetical protein [Agrobacterium sp. fls2-241-TYG-188a]